MGEMITQTPFSQAIRDHFPSWSAGRSSLSAHDLEKLASDPKLSGQDLAVLKVVKDLPAQVGGHDLNSHTLEKYESHLSEGGPGILERRYQDNLERLETPRQLFPQRGADSNAVFQGAEQNCVLPPLALLWPSSAPSV